MPKKQPRADDAAEAFELGMAATEYRFRISQAIALLLPRAKYLTRSQSTAFESARAVVKRLSLQPNRTFADVVPVITACLANTDIWCRNRRGFGKDMSVLWGQWKTSGLPYSWGSFLQRRVDSMIAESSCDLGAKIWEKLKPSRFEGSLSAALTAACGVTAGGVFATTHRAFMLGWVVNQAIYSPMVVQSMAADFSPRKPIELLKAIELANKRIAGSQNRKRRSSENKKLPATRRPMIVRRFEVGELEPGGNWHERMQQLIRPFPWSRSFGSLKPSKSMYWPGSEPTITFREYRLNSHANVVSAISHRLSYPWHTTTDERDKWMYEMRHDGKTAKQIIRILNSDFPEWDSIGSEYGVKKAIDAFADRFGLERIRSRRGRSPSYR